MVDTDKYWQRIGRDNPYWGVLTADKWRANNLTDEAVEEFYSSGERHVETLFQTIRNHIDQFFFPTAALDFGCGVGRVLIPLANQCQTAVGIDVSEGMLQLAQERSDLLGLSNVRLLTSDDQLSSVTQTFDLVHSYVVFQHISCVRGYVITRRLLQLLKDQGVGILHFVYCNSDRSRHPAVRALVKRLGLHPIVSTLRKVSQRLTSVIYGRDADEQEMQMNPYDMNIILQTLQNAGVRRLYAEYTDHGGSLGVILFFKKGSSGTDA